MPLNTRELLNAASVLAESRNMRVTVKESFKGGCVAGASTMVGGLLLGPAGMLIGGIVGACSAAAMGRGKFRPVADVLLHDMTASQQERLAQSLRSVLADVRVEDAALLLPLLMNNANLQTLVVRELVGFLQGEMGLHIMS
ncbi:protein C19orf12 homolog [Bacillus rossius redtenbacheri]|uniref:protein C19orf12 homolog n=1 Tax=Bacillus rossius redtenbacheri TaxID=93214 RepID=UPI002FDEC34B